MIVSIAVQKQLQVILQLIGQICQILIWRRQTAGLSQFSKRYPEFTINFVY